MCLWNRKVHLDSYDLRPAFRGRAIGPSQSRSYRTDGGNLVPLRHDNLKNQHSDRSAHGLGDWQEPSVTWRAPILTNLRSDPVERVGEEDARGHQRLEPELQGLPGAHAAR